VGFYMVCMCVALNIYNYCVWGGERKCWVICKINAGIVNAFLFGMCRSGSLAA